MLVLLELLHLPVKFDEAARAEEKQRTECEGEKEKATAMTVMTGRRGCLLGDGGNKMEVDKR